MTISLRQFLAIAAAVLLTATSAMYAQTTGTISGVVTEDDGLPIAGGTVRIVGGTQGAITRANGSFMIAGVRAGDYDLQTRAVGFQPTVSRAHVTIGATTTLSIQLGNKYGLRCATHHPADSTIDVTYSGGGVPFGSLRLRAYRIVDPIMFFNFGGQPNGYNRYYNGGAFPVRRWINDSEPAGDEQLNYTLAAEWEMPLMEPASNGIITQRIPCPVRSPGVYVITMDNGTATVQRTLVITRYNVVIKHAPEGALIFAADTRTGVRAPNFPLTCIRSSGLREHTATDFDGTLMIEGSADWARCAQMIVGQWNGNILFADDLAAQSAPAGRAVLHLQTDRPVYRPNQTAHYRGILRTPSARGYDVPRPRDMFVTVRDAKGQEIRRDTLRLSSHGTFNGSVQIGPNASLGDYYVYAACDLGYGSMSFSVREYRKPEFRVDVRAGTGRLTKGDTIRAVVAARYFFGAPVADAAVAYTVDRRRLMTANGSASAYATAESYLPRTVDTGTARLGSDGTCTIRCATDAGLPGDYEYLITATVTDRSRRAIDGCTSVLATESNLVPRIACVRNYVEAGDRTTIDVRVADYDSGAVRAPFTITARAVRIGEDTIAGHGANAGHATPATPVLWRATGVTDSAGHATLEWSPPDAGILEVMVHVRDARGAERTSVCTTYVVGPGLERAIGAVPLLRLIPERSRWAEGERVRALLIAPKADADALITAEGATLYDHDVVRVRDRFAEITMAQPKRYTPTFSLNALMLAEGRLYTDSATIDVEATRKEFRIEISGDKRRYRPGEDGTITVRAIGAKGEPVEDAEIAVGISDAALYRIEADRTLPLAAVFYPAAAPVVRTSYTPGAMRGVIDNITVVACRADVATRSGVLRAATGAEMLSAIDGSRTTIQGAVALSSGVTTAGVNGFAIRGGRASETTFRVDGIEAGDPFNGGFDGGFSGGFGSGGNGADALPAAPDAPVRRFAAAAIRSDFRDRVAWEPALLTDADGYARISVRFPDNITAWRIAARGVTDDTRIGEATFDVETAKDLLVRMETPRFVVNGDSLVIATVVHNYLPREKLVTMRLRATGMRAPLEERTVTIAPGADARVDWPVTAAGVDSGTITVRAMTDEESDAAQTTLPIVPRGMKLTSTAATDVGLRERSGSVTIEVPATSDPATRMLTIGIAPSIAATMLGALDDMIGYPYGCAEQTMSRFLPTIVVADALRNLKAPVRSEHIQELPAMAAGGVARLCGFQHADGGWGWWFNDATHPFMTAYVLYGLATARGAGYPVPDDAIGRGTASLLSQIGALPRRTDSSAANVAGDPTTEAYMLYVASRVSGAQRAALLADRITEIARFAHPSNYTLALLALAARGIERKDLADTLAQRLIARATTDRSGMHWDADGPSNRWQSDPLETSAYALRVLLGTDGNEHLANEIVRWLQAQKRGSSWGSTRRSAMVVYALAEYLRHDAAAGEPLAMDVRVNGRLLRHIEISGDELFAPEQRIVLRGAEVPAGTDVVRVEKSDGGIVHVAAWAEYYEDVADVRPASAGFSVEREYATLERASRSGDLTLTKRPLRGAVRSGTEMLVTVRVVVDSVRDFFLLEEPIPAGCVVVEDTDGYRIEGEPEYGPIAAGTTRRAWYSAREVHDRHIAFFAGRMTPGTYTFTYILRAQIPGSYAVLPSVGMLNYFPVVRGNGGSDQMMILE